VQQSEIRDLLAELARSECSFLRHQEVSQRFHEAAKRRPAPDSPNDNTSSLFVMILNRLLRIANRQHLPGLFPVFALLCGDRDDLDVLADVDWSLML
jgi:hypothetical protein